MIPFNKPASLGTEITYINESIQNHILCGNGPFTKRCHDFLEKSTGATKVLLTASCTHALEMAALLSDIQEGDEVILPSYTFVSTANAFALRGAMLVFVDIRPDTMNLDESLIEQAITPRTKVIVPVHYAGVACEMDTILEIARQYHLLVVEDAAQGIMSSYKGRPLGTIGDIGCYSFHETKNVTCGEGGAVLLKSSDFVERAEIIREKGTNRNKFFRGQVDKYSWVDIGSSYLPSELNAAYLCAQLEQADEITNNRLHSWNRYWEALTPLAKEGCIQLPVIPPDCTHNAHMFYIKCAHLEERTRLIEYLKANDILSVFHYVPLHSAPAASGRSRFFGEDRYTTTESNRLVRLPLYYGMTDDEIEKVIEKVKEFYGNPSSH